MNSPSRRVLGDKDKNATLNIRSPKTNHSHPKSTFTPLANTWKMSSDRDSASSIHAGSKRKIEEVEDAERVEHEDGLESQRTQLLSDSEPEPEDDSPNQISTSNAHTSYETADTSFTASQNPLEPTFELHHEEEFSQRTLDKLNEVPMPQNNSQPPFLRPALLQETSAGSVGLSSFVNFEGPPSTQASDNIEPINELPLPTGNGSDIAKVADGQVGDQQDSEAASRKQMLTQKAVELQTRLQLALYKVRTKQTSQPFSRLKVPKPSRDRSSSPPAAWMPVLKTPQLTSSTIREPSSTRTVHQVSIEQFSDHDIHSAEAGIAAMRARATAQPKPPVANLNNLPIPQLDPALVHAGLTFESNATQAITEQDSQGQRHFPSSPPLSRQASTGSDRDIEFQLLEGIREAARKDEEKQLSSPPVSERGTDLSRSVSKGEAASGLVALMNAAQ